MSFNFCLGISIFLLGLRLLSNSLDGALGRHFRKIMTSFISTRFRSVLFGLVSTGIVQSSSAIAATMVRLVNSGILSLTQALGIILGANIGTTITAQIIAFDLQAVAAPLMLIGGFCVLFLHRRSLGEALFGFGSLLFGLTIINSTLVPILDSDGVRFVLLNLTDQIWQAILVGTILTAIIQSSSAVIGITITLASLNALSLSAAIGLALGSNIGTVVTTLLSSIGTNRESKATAYADLLFNALGVLLVLPFFSGFLTLVKTTSPILTRQIVNAHTLFNVVTALIALPFLNYLARIAWRWAGIQLKKKK